MVAATRASGMDMCMMTQAKFITTGFGDEKEKKRGGGEGWGDIG